MKCVSRQHIYIDSHIRIVRLGISDGLSPENDDEDITRFIVPDRERAQTRTSGK